MPIEPLKETQRLIRACFYGPLGQGKTTMTGMICKALGGRTLDVTADSAWATLTNPEFEGLEIDRIPFKSGGKDTTWEQLKQIFDSYGDGATYQNLMLDPFSTMSDIGRLHWTRTVPLADQRHPMISSWSHYNIVKDTFTESIVPLLNESKLNVFFICHDRLPSEDEKAKAKGQIRPNLPSETFNRLGQECNLLGYCSKPQPTKYLINTAGSKQYAAKSQIPTVPQREFDQSELPQMLVDWVNYK